MMVWFSKVLTCHGMNSVLLGIGSGIFILRPSHQGCRKLPLFSFVFYYTNNINAVHESESMNTFLGVTSSHRFLVSTCYGDPGLGNFFSLMDAANILHNGEMHFSFRILNFYPQTWSRNQPFSSNDSVLVLCPHWIDYICVKESILGHSVS